MEYRRDVGGCCGTYVLNGFGGQWTQVAENQMLALMAEREMDVRGRNREHLVAGKRPYEGRQIANVLTVAYLTDEQMAAGWAPRLKRLGFRLVTRYYNSNSGNNVNVLHRSDTRASRRNADLPFDWPARG